MFLKIYNEAFPLPKITVKASYLGIIWIKTGIKSNQRRNSVFMEIFEKSKLQ